MEQMGRQECPRGEEGRLGDPRGGIRCPIGSKATFDGFSDEGIAGDLKDPMG